MYNLNTYCIIFISRGSWSSWISNSSERFNCSLKWIWLWNSELNHEPGSVFVNMNSIWTALATQLPNTAGDVTLTNVVTPSQTAVTGSTAWSPVTPLILGFTYKCEHIGALQKHYVLTFYPGDWAECRGATGLFWSQTVLPTAASKVKNNLWTWTFKSCDLIQSSRTATELMTNSPR